MLKSEPSKKAASKQAESIAAWCLLGLFFNPRDGSDIYFPNVG
jgi:hypothetical protein